MRRILQRLIPSLLLAATAMAGTNGILEGTVRDKNTNEKIPGVAVLVVGTQQGSASNAEGYFQVQNIRAGTYDVRFSHVGYQTLIIKNITVNPDLRTKLHIQMEPVDVQMQEIIVIQEKPPIQRDVTGGYHFCARLNSREVAILQDAS
jgi:hypothetical protein